jgi:predicted Mrr-cat superfamily restriction endonuclease
MKYDVWVIVLSPGDRDYSNFCFDTGVIATGWADINGYQHVIAKEDEEILEAYDKAYGGEAWADDSNRNKAIYALGKIANEIKVGDKILVRKGNKNLLAIGEITGDYKFKEEWVNLDIAHVRDVRYTAVAKERNLFDIMVKHLKKQFSMGHTIYSFGEVDHKVWCAFEEEARNKVLSEQT